MCADWSKVVFFYGLEVNLFVNCIAKSSLSYPNGLKQAVSNIIITKLIISGYNYTKVEHIYVKYDDKHQKQIAKYM